MHAIILALWLAAPEAEKPAPEQGPPAAEAPAEGPVEAPVEAPREDAAQPKPPPPSVEPEPAPPIVPRPAPTPVPPEPEQDEFDYPLRDASDMPFAPTAARKSAVRRNNQVLVRDFHRPVYSVTAYGRFAMLLDGGRDVIQPYGYGFAAALRIHALRVAKSRFGAELHAGHARFPERGDYPTIDGEATIRRTSLLSASDFSVGPSFEIPIGPLFVTIGAEAGVALSTLLRPVSADSAEDQLVSTSNFMVRGGPSIGIPLLNHHGLSIAAAAHHIFSPREVPIDPTLPEGETTRPFGTWLEISLGYQIWF